MFQFLFDKCLHVIKKIKQGELSMRDLRRLDL